MVDETRHLLQAVDGAYTQLAVDEVAFRSAWQGPTAFCQSGMQAHEIRLATVDTH